MDPQHIDRFRKLLLEQRERVTSEVAEHREVEEAPLAPDPEEKAAQAATSLVENRITTDDENLLRKIDFALERLEAGTYQQCENCGKKIPLDRLYARPSASLCLACQEAKDAGRLD